MNYDTRYPSIHDLKIKAKRKLPRFAFDYVDGGIDQENGKIRNRAAWHTINLTPRYLTDITNTALETSLFGKTYDMGFGVPPIGLGNMMWPNAELSLASAAQKANIPYVLSTFSTTDLDLVANTAPDVCWFQLYVPRDEDVMRDMIKRVKIAGYHALVVTLDIPVGAKRNRELKNALKLPFSLTPDIVIQSILHPNWALGTLANGTPDFVNVMRYKKNTTEGLAEFVTNFSMAGVTTDRLKLIRQLWDGPLILKGIQSADNMRAAVNLGVDGVVISNHGGRQLDAAPTTVESLAELGEKFADEITVMVDSGIRTGMDVVRAKALGSHMAFSGRSFYWGIGALGQKGGNQVTGIFKDEITRTLKQLGCHSYAAMDRSWLSDQE